VGPLDDAEDLIQLSSPEISQRTINHDLQEEVAGSLPEASDLSSWDGRAAWTNVL
jgi:hypothetical protein